MKIKTENVKHKQELLAVLALYGISGKHLRIRKDTLGVVNETYFVFDNNKKWVLRKSSPYTTLQHLQLEQKLLVYLPKHGFRLAPRTLLNKFGQSISHFSGSLFTLQEFSPGKIIGSWDDVSRFTKPRADAFFAMIAQFSKATRNFVNSPRAGSHLWHHVQNGHKSFSKILSAMPRSEGKKVLVKNKKNILSFFVETKRQFKESRYEALPKQLVHFDWHLGNVHFKGNKIVGAFDFDWAQFDSRLTDVANAIGMSCYYYGGPLGGQFRKDMIKRALYSYRKAYGKSEFSIEKENNLIKIALRGFMLFQLIWAGNFYTKQPSAKRLKVLRHFINVITNNDYEQLFSF